MITYVQRTASMPNLHAELEATASHLARRPVKVIFPERTVLVDMIRRTALRKGRDQGRAGEIAGGALCSLQENGDIHILLDIDNPPGRLYRYFLHEAGHALYMGWEMPDDEETVASHQASMWAVSIARREPKDMSELMAWLKILRTFDEEQHVYFPVVVAGTIQGARRISFSEKER